VTEEDMTNGRHHPWKRPGDRNHQQAGRAQIPKVTPNRSRRVLLVAAAVGLGAIATGVSLAAFSSPSSQAGHIAGASNGSSAATARSPQPTPPVASSTTGPNITSAGIAKTVMEYPPQLKGQILRWSAGSGGTAWSSVTAQLGSVTQTGGTRLYSQLRLECASLGSSVRTARSAPPIPDKIMQRSYAKVLAGLAIAAADCRDAISVRSVGDEGQQIDVNKVLLNRSLAQFGAESRALYMATAEIRTLRR
jgi:hypothetical protein